MSLYDPTGQLTGKPGAVAPEEETPPLYDPTGQMTGRMPSVAPATPDTSPTAPLVRSFDDCLEGDLLGGCDPVRIYQGGTAVGLQWLLPAGVNLTGAEAELLLVPRRRRSVCYAFGGAVQATPGTAATQDAPATAPALGASFTTVWDADDPPDPGPYWARVRCTLAGGTVLDTSPVLLIVTAAPAPTSP